MNMQLHHTDIHMHTSTHSVIYYIHIRYSVSKLPHIHSHSSLLLSSALKWLGSRRPLSHTWQSAIFNPLRMIIEFALSGVFLPTTPLLHLSHLTPLCLSSCWMAWHSERCSPLAGVQMEQAEYPRVSVWLSLVHSKCRRATCLFMWLKGAIISVSSTFRKMRQKHSSLYCTDHLQWTWSVTWDQMLLGPIK